LSADGLDKTLIEALQKITNCGITATVIAVFGSTDSPLCSKESVTFFKFFDHKFFGLFCRFIDAPHP